jgi:hypothetical protein
LVLPSCWGGPSYLTQEQIDKLPNGKVGKGYVTGLLRRVSSEEEKRIDVETPTFGLGGSNRLAAL